MSAVQLLSHDNVKARQLHADITWYEIVAMLLLSHPNPCLNQSS
jgi:hypothetical protein